MNDISNKEDVKIFVNAFYEKVRDDIILSVVFNSKIRDEDWPKHLERMYSFWNTVLFGIKDYRGNPFSKHSSLPVEKLHFEKWVDLLTITIKNNFSGPKADEVIFRAQKMSMMFQSKLEYLRTNNNYKNIV